MQAQTQTFNSNDDYTRAIIGERLLLTLGRVVTVPGIDDRFKPAVKVKRNSPWKTALIFAFMGLLGPAAIFVGYRAVAPYLRFVNAVPMPVDPAVQKTLPITAPNMPQVNVTEQEYRPGGPLPTLPFYPPSPVSLAPVPLPEMPQAGSEKGQEKKTDKEDKAEKPIQSAVLFDESAEPSKQQAKEDAKVTKKEAAKEAPKESHKPEPKKPSPKTEEKPQGKEARATSLPPASTLPPMPANKAKPVAEADQKFAVPVEERPVQLVAKPAQDTQESKPAATPKEGRITLVDIPADGKTVLVTNPQTRLPMKLSVGQALPNGKVIQSIDPKAGTVSAGGSTYTMD